MVQSAVLLPCGIIVAQLVGVVTISEKCWVMAECAVSLLVTGGWHVRSTIGGRRHPLVVERTVGIVHVVYV